MIGPTLGWGTTGAGITVGGWGVPVGPIFIAGPSVPVIADLLGATTADLDMPPLFTLVNSQQGAAGLDGAGMTLSDVSPAFWFDPGPHGDELVVYWTADVLNPGDTISFEALIYDGIANQYVSAGRALDIEEKTLVAFDLAGARLAAIRVIDVSGLLNDPGNNLKLWAASCRSDPATT